MAVEVFWSSESSHGLKTSMRGLAPGSSSLGAIPYLLKAKESQQNVYGEVELIIQVFHGA